MPANRRRGEVEAEFDGRACRLVLTLGALAELEDAFAVSDLTALAERFESGRLSACDVIKILGAGLRGAGADLADADVARLSHAEGAAGFVRTVGDLLRAAFGHGGEGGPAAEGPLDRSLGTS